MRKFTALKALAVAGAMLAAAPATAANPVVDGAGKLTGATGVVVTPDTRVPAAPDTRGRGPPPPDPHRRAPHGARSPMRAAKRSGASGC